jgi:hypothetical protein
MSVLKEVQTAAVDGKSDLGMLLRKCKVLAARLDSELLENWLLWESNGYPENVDVPDYRVWGLQLKGHFFGPFGSGIQNAPIPLVCVPEEARKHYERYECRQSIASVEAALKTDPATLQVSTGDLAVMLGTRVYQGQNCVQAWAEFGAGHLVELLNSVRNRILDFALAIGKVDPIAGEEGSGHANSPLKPSRITQIFRTTVYGGSATLVGSASNSSLAFNVVTNDLNSLANTLRQHGLSREDIQELQLALAADARPTAKDKFGPKVATWMGKMVEKAASGSWQIGVTVAGELLSQAIARYYGL